MKTYSIYFRRSIYDWYTVEASSEAEAEAEEMFYEEVTPIYEEEMTEIGSISQFE